MSDTEPTVTTVAYVPEECACGAYLHYYDMGDGIVGQYTANCESCGRSYLAEATSWNVLVEAPPDAPNTETPLEGSVPVPGQVYVTCPDCLRRYNNLPDGGWSYAGAPLPVVDALNSVEEHAKHLAAALSTLPEPARSALRARFPDDSFPDALIAAATATKAELYDQGARS